MLSGEVAALPRLLTRLDSFSDIAPAFMLASGACCAPESRLPRSLLLPLAFPLACRTGRPQRQVETIDAVVGVLKASDLEVGQLVDSLPKWQSCLQNLQHLVASVIHECTAQFLNGHFEAHTHDMPISDPALPVDAAWLTLGEAGYEEPSRESPRRGVC